MGTETWRVGAVKRIESTMIREVDLSNVFHTPSHKAPTDLRVTLDTTGGVLTAEQRQAACDTVIAFFGDDVKAATEVLVMLDLVA